MNTEDAKETDRYSVGLKKAVQHRANSSVLPDVRSLQKARSALLQQLPEIGKGLNATSKHLLQDIAPGLNGSSLNPRYYGYITGGVTPAARLADSMVSAFDQNVHVHLEQHSVSTDVEVQALGLLQDLLELDRDLWTGKTFTTGATAANIVGLACARQAVLESAFKRQKPSTWDKQALETLSRGDLGLVEAFESAGLKRIQILTTSPHASLLKAASVVGLGRVSVVDVGRADDPYRVDHEKLVRLVRKIHVASILCISCGEVNTGYFATNGLGEMEVLRGVCQKYGVWIHVDGAFGIFGRVLDMTTEFASIRRGCEGMELADSIAGDAHKLLNVPYDCGFFFTRHPDIAVKVFQNQGAAYVTAKGPDPSLIPSPFHIGIENSSRFRALPVYATLTAYGHSGYRNMLERQIRFARHIATFLFDHDSYETLPEGLNKDKLIQKTFMIVLFRAKDRKLNRLLTQKINATRKVYVSRTTWGNRFASRIAVSNWQVDDVRDFGVVSDVLNIIAGKQTETKDPQESPRDSSVGVGISVTVEETVPREALTQADTAEKVDSGLGITAEELTPLETPKATETVEEEPQVQQETPSRHLDPESELVTQTSLLEDVFLDGEPKTEPATKSAPAPVPLEDEVPLDLTPTKSKEAKRPLMSRWLSRNKGLEIRTKEKQKEKEEKSGSPRSLRKKGGEKRLSLKGFRTPSSRVVESEEPQEKEVAKEVN